MRKTFIDTLTLLAEQDPNLYLITGDLGFSFFEPFAQRFGHRFINAGVAEQHMVSMAAGLAMTGKNVYVYSIAPFVTMRPFEQVRVDICYHNLPVKLVSVGGGYGYGQFAGTHHSLEDIALMRSLPGMTVVAPANKIEAQALMLEMNKLAGPSYLRLAKNAENSFYPATSDIKLGQVVEIYPDYEQVIIASGQMLDRAIEIRELMKKNNITLGVVSCPTIKPLDKQFFMKIKGKVRSLFTLEEHSVIGGLGEAIARLSSEEGLALQHFKAFGVEDCFLPVIGSQDFMCEQAGLGARHLAERITTILNR